jgi:hypothetical protein
MHVTSSSLAVFYVPVYLLFGAQFWRHCPFMCRFLLNRHLRLLNLPSPLRQLNFLHTLLVELLIHGIVAFCQLAMYCASARCKDQQSGSSHNSGICTSCVFLASHSKILYSHKKCKENSQSMHMTSSSLAVFYMPVYLVFGAQFWRKCPFNVQIFVE